MQDPVQQEHGVVGWLSLAQLISWGSVFYTFALLMALIERELAQYVSRDHVASLNGALGLPLALARAAAPLLLGVLWTAQSRYRDGLWLLLAFSLVGVGALMLAQRISLARRQRPE